MQCHTPSVHRHHYYLVNTSIYSCFLAKAYCKDDTIHKAHEGECPVITTVAPTEDPIIHGSEVAFDIFCLDVSYIECGTDGPILCADDGKVYANL